MSSSTPSYRIWVGHFPPNVSADHIYDEMSPYKPKMAQYEPLNGTIELTFSDEASMSCAFHALNGRNLFGRILVAKPHPLIPMASFPINQSNPLPPPIPVCDQNVATRIGRLLVARPDFYNAVILLLNNHGLPSPFYDTSQSPSHMPVLDDKAPAITERVKRSASDIENSEIVPSSISKVPKLVETDEGVLSAEVNQPLHFQPRETSSKPPTVRNLSLLLDSFSASQSSGHPVEVVPFATQSSLDSDTAGFAPVVCITKEQLVSNRITEDQIRSIPRFEDWDPGVPSPKLFVKNLSPKATESDLRFIFGRYATEQPRDVHIKLMSRGKLHGQAFITLPDTSAARLAIAEVSGYLLHDRPMILEFGKSKS